MKDFILNVHVIPDSKESEVKGFDEWSRSLKVKVREKAMKGKANTELEKKLKKFFGKEVKIIKGEKNKNKKVLIKNTSLKEIKSKINQLKGFS
ncbi:MAG: DUF167 domain-containing protein [archaeon]|nr:YggU family protein [Candidatus Micrarchaeota archaeon]